jgi:general secretion pathway protein K
MRGLGVERERGIAIVAALWAAAILAVITAGVLQLVRAQAGLGRSREDTVVLGAIADGAMNLTILALLGPSGAQWPVDGSPKVVPFAGHDVQVGVHDEAGKIDLNMVGDAALRQVLTAVGLDAEAAQGLAENIAAWRARGRSDDDRVARKIPFQSVEELQLVPGITPALYAKLVPLVTVYSQTPWIDPAFASPAVLAVFRNSNADADAAWRRLEEERAGLQPRSTSPGVVLGHAFTIVAELRTPAARITRTAVVRLTGQPREPLLVYLWR